MTKPLVVRRETHIAAPPATAFAFLTDPAKIVGWMGIQATPEVHPGGLYLVKGVHCRAEHSVMSCQSIVFSVGRESKRCRHDRAWSRSILLTGMAAPHCA
jgi:hypothetical protein